MTKTVTTYQAARLAESYADALKVLEGRRVHPTQSPVAVVAEFERLQEETGVKLFSEASLEAAKRYAAEQVAKDSKVWAEARRKRATA